MHISILNQAEIKTMTSREIADLTDKRHDHVTRDIEKMLIELGEDVPKFGGIYLDSYGREQADFRLNRELTETLLTGYSAVLRRKVIVRWRELEGQTNQPVAMSRIDILTMALDSERRAIAAESQLTLAAPKAAFVDAYVDTTGLKGFRQVAKLLKAKENQLREFLTTKQIMYRLGGEWHPYQNHIDAGRLEVKTGSSEVSGHAFNRSFFTSKGVEWLAGLWAVHSLRSVAV
jgi:phage antirepressor YoqD-like protein